MPRLAVFAPFLAVLLLAACGEDSPSREVELALDENGWPVHCYACPEREEQVAVCFLSQDGCPSDPDLPCRPEYSCGYPCSTDADCSLGSCGPERVRLYGGGSTRHCGLVLK